MISVIDALLKGDDAVAAKFATAKQFWDDFYISHRGDDVKTLANALGTAQSHFEWKLDMDRAFAKEIMPVTAIGSLYDEVDGFADNRDLAQRMIEAFERSLVSIEVKGYAEKAAKIYGLNPLS